VLLLYNKKSEVEERFGEYPDYLKNSQIAPIPKYPFPSMHSHYRPIFINPILCAENLLKVVGLIIG